MLVHFGRPGLDAADDPEFERVHFPRDEQICSDRLRVRHLRPPAARRRGGDRDTASFDCQAPSYLLHTNWELQLLLEAARRWVFSDLYPSSPFELRGSLRPVGGGCRPAQRRHHEPFEEPNRKWLGHRTVYYAPKVRGMAHSRDFLEASRMSWCGGWKSTSNGSGLAVRRLVDQDLLGTGALGGATFLLRGHGGGAGLGRVLPDCVRCRPLSESLPVRAYWRKTSAADVGDWKGRHHQICSWGTLSPPAHHRIATGRPLDGVRAADTG